MTRFHKIFLVVLLAAIPVLGMARGHASTPSRWSRYDARRTTSQVVRIVVKTRCLNAEDSAAQLRLLDYGSGRAVYGCSRKGY